MRVYVKKHNFSLAHIMFKVSLKCRNLDKKALWVVMVSACVSTFTLRGRAPNWHKASLAYLIPLLSPSTTINLNPVDVFLLVNNSKPKCFDHLHHSSTPPLSDGHFLADSSHFLSFDTWTLPLGAPNGVQLLEAPNGLQIQFQIVIYS